MRVVVTGVVSKPALNGLEGVVERALPTGRVAVVLKGHDKPVSLRPSNLLMFIGPSAKGFQKRCSFGGCKINPWSILYPIGEHLGSEAYNTPFFCADDCIRQPLSLKPAPPPGELRRIVAGERDAQQKHNCWNGGGEGRFSFGAVVSNQVQGEEADPVVKVPGGAGAGRCGCDLLTWSLCRRSGRFGAVRHLTGLSEDSTAGYCVMCGECSDPRRASHCDNPGCDRCCESSARSPNPECSGCGLLESQSARVRKRAGLETFVAAVDAGAAVDVDRRGAAAKVELSDPRVQEWLAGVRAKLAKPFDPYEVTKEDREEMRGGDDFYYLLEGTEILSE